MNDNFKKIRFERVRIILGNIFPNRLFILREWFHFKDLQSFGQKIAQYGEFTPQTQLLGQIIFFHFVK